MASLKTLIFTIFLAIALVSGDRAFAGPESEIIDVVFDLDDTLIRWLRPDEPFGPDTLIFPRDGSEINGYRYRVLDGAREMLLSLAQDPRIRISFFSLGERARNIKIVEDFQLPEGSVYKILSMEDATPNGSKKAKDLRKINPDLSRVIMLDDTPELILSPQRNLVLHIGNKPVHHYLKVQETPGVDAKWSRATPVEFVTLRNRLPRAWTVLHLTLKRITSGESASEALSKVMELQRARNKPIELYRAGAQEFHRINPKYRFTPALPEAKIGCIRSQVEVLIRAAESGSRTGR